MDELREYYHLDREIAEQEARLEREKNKASKIRKTIVSDSVKGTRIDGSYGNIRIEGIPSSEFFTKEYKILCMADELEANIKKLENKRANALKQINDIDRSFIRRILRLKYMDNMTWQQVADTMSEGRKEYTADSIRMSVERYFKKK